MSMKKGFANNPYLDAVVAIAEAEGSVVVPICNKLEAEISELEDDEKAEFLEEMGMQEPGLNRVIRAGYKLLGLQTYFTRRRKRSSRPGQSRSVPQRPKVQARFTLTSRKALSAPKLLATTTILPATANREQKTPANGVSKARTTSLRTATLFTSDLTSSPVVSQLSGRWKVGLLLALTTAILWGILPIALKGVMETLDPITTTFFRFALAAVLLTPYFLKPKRIIGITNLNSRLRSPRLFLQLLAAGLLLIGNYAMYISGLQKTTAEAAQLMIQVAPMLLLLRDLAVWRASLAPSVARRSRFRHRARTVFLSPLSRCIYRPNRLWRRHCHDLYRRSNVDRLRHSAKIAADSI